MTQQAAYFNADAKYKKRLFVDAGSEFIEVNARIIEPYSPPEPQLKIKDRTIISGPSTITGQGIASYKCTLRLLFYSRAAYSEYLNYISATHKFYDEKGSIFLGAVESTTRTVYEAAQKYVVELNLILLKKDSYDKQRRAQFLDLVDPGTLEPLWFANDVQELADIGVTSTINRDGSPVLYYNPDLNVSRAEFVTLLNRTRRWIERRIIE